MVLYQVIWFLLIDVLPQFLILLGFHFVEGVGVFLEVMLVLQVGVQSCDPKLCVQGVFVIVVH